MGHKVHPNGFRLGVSRTWNAKWYADRDYTDLLKEDMTIRKLVAQAARQRQRQPGRDRARHQPRDGHRPHRQAGHRHRQGRRQRGGAAPAGRPAHNAQGQAGDQGDPPAGARRGPGGRQHRPAADAPHRLPQGHQAGHPADHEGRRQGREDRRRPAASAAPRWPAASGTRKAASRWARCAPTSATARSTPAPRTARIGVKVWIYRGDVMPERTARRTRPSAAAAAEGPDHVDAQARQAPQGACAAA